MKSIFNFFRRQKAIAEAEIVDLAEPVEQPKVFVAAMVFEDDDDWDDDVDDFDDEDPYEFLPDDEDDDEDDDDWD